MCSDWRGNRAATAQKNPANVSREVQLPLFRGALLTTAAMNGFKDRERKTPRRHRAGRSSWGRLAHDRRAVIDAGWSDEVRGQAAPSNRPAFSIAF